MILVYTSYCSKKLTELVEYVGNMKLGLLGGTERSDELSISDGLRNCDEGLRFIDKWLALDKNSHHLKEIC